MYFPPDRDTKRETIAHVARLFEYLRAKYSKFGLVAFGDLNSGFLHRPEAPGSRQMTRLIEFCGLSVIKDLDSGTVTRSQGSKSSYLDYFLSTGVLVSKVSVGERFGPSDHHLVSCHSVALTPVKRRRQQIFSKKKAAQLVEDLFEDCEAGGCKDSALYALKPFEFFQELSRRSRLQSIIFVPKPTNYFKVINTVEEELRLPSPNWKRVRKTIISCGRTEFLALLEKAKTCKLDNQMKEFHSIIQNVLRIRKQNCSVQELEVSEDKGQIVYQPEKLQKILSDKYQCLFDSATKRAPFDVGAIKPAKETEVRECAELIGCGKGLGIDCISDAILQSPNQGLRKRILGFVNAVFAAGRIPKPFCCARLHLLNKLKLGTP